MRFSTAWADVAAQNVTLKFVIAALSLALVAVATAAAKLGLKDPLVIERGCLTTTAALSTGSSVTDSEVHAFVADVLPRRFGSSQDAKVAFLSPTQAKARSLEMDDLTKKGMRQTLLVQGVSINGDVIRVDADRLIAVEKIRSAFPVVLDVAVSRVPRSESNPYGLVLTGVTSIEAKDGGK